MTGKTHLAVGNAASLIILQPKTVGELLLCIGASTVGAVICDIDIKGSGSRRVLNKILAILCVCLVIFMYIELKWKFGIYSSLSTSIGRMLFGCLLFILICVYGKHKPHRSFMHSALGMLILTISVYIIIPEASIYFCIAMISHIIIDMLNYKKVNILYPSKYSISFDVCKADGIINKILFYIAFFMIFLYLLYLVI